MLCQVEGWRGGNIGRVLSWCRAMGSDPQGLTPTHFPLTFAHVSRRPTVRLKTGWPGAESRSRQK